MSTPRWPFAVVVNSVDDKRFAFFMDGLRRSFGEELPEVVRIRDARSMAEGLNRGARATSAEWLLFCHDDIAMLSGDAPAQLLHAMGQVDIFGIAGTRRMVSGNWYDSGRPHTLGHVVARDPHRPGSYELQVFSSDPQALALGAVALDGVMIGCRRTLFDQLGGFDEERFQDFHGYDAEFTFRASLAGARMAVLERLIVLHDSSVSHFSEAKLRAWEEAQASFVERFGPHLSKEPGDRGQGIIPLARASDAPHHVVGWRAGLRRLRQRLRA